MERKIELKITRSLRIPAEIDESVISYSNNLGIDNISKSYEHFIKIGIELYKSKIKLESDPTLEPKIKADFLETIQKLTNEKIMFDEVAKIPKNQLNAMIMMFKMEKDRREDTRDNRYLK